MEPGSAEDNLLIADELDGSLPDASQEASFRANVTSSRHSEHYVRFK